MRAGKARGIAVTCEVAPHHFVLTDEALAGYDTNTKMNPPLRPQADVDALVDGLADGSVDVIATDHAPHHADEKALSFDQAPFGIIGLETAVSLTFDRLVHTGRIGLSRMVELLSVNPARILGVTGGALTRRRAGRHLGAGAGPGGDRACRDAAVAVQEHAVRGLDPARRRRRDHRRRPRRLPQHRACDGTRRHGRPRAGPVIVGSPEPAHMTTQRIDDVRKRAQRILQAPTC